MRSIFECKDLFTRANFWPDFRIFIGLKQYIMIGIPNLIIMMIDMYSWEVGAFASAYIS